MGIDYGLLMQQMAIMSIACLYIMYACNAFEQAASYIGRNMQGGARGVLIDAIGSSLPELMVTLMFVASGKPELILAGVAVTAGSAVFNSLLIPALSIIFAKDGNGDKVESFALRRPVVIRDGAYLLAVEAVLIYFLGMDYFTMTMAATLLAMYVMYAVHVIKDSKKLASENDACDYEYESLESRNIVEAVFKLDFNYILFNDNELSNKTAWSVLALATTAVGVACHYLAVSIEGVANALDVAVFFSAVVFGAAATSLPDTILSVKSARRGEGDDAVGNAIGSNTFDVAISLPLPIFLYLMLEGGALPIEQSDDLLALRYFVIGSTAAV
ncbi:MAG: sodium:calcium antiporter, partial [Glaciecola sp.]